MMFLQEYWQHLTHSKLELTILKPQRIQKTFKKENFNYPEESMETSVQLHLQINPG